jgi:hypothetical protein
MCAEGAFSEVLTKRYQVYSKRAVRIEKKIMCAEGAFSEVLTKRYQVFPPAQTFRRDVTR